MRAALILTLVLSGCGLARADLRVRPQLSPIANLVYQLDCISEAIPHCSRDTYLNLWKTNFITGEAEWAKIKAWRDLTERYALELKLEDAKARRIRSRFEGVKLSTKLRIASFQSATLDEYLTRLDLVLAPQDRAKSDAIIRHFYSAFEPWWRKVALPKSKFFAKQTETALASRHMALKIRQFAHFYGAVLPANYVIYLNLFFRPLSKEATAGEQIENYSITEFLSEEKPSDRLDVIAHELCHFLFDSATDEHIEMLQQQVDREGTAEARAAYNLMNETLATALGNGIVRRATLSENKWTAYVAKPRSFYNDDEIDRATKAILPWIEGWVREGKTLHDAQFFKNYLALLKSSLGGVLTAPRLLLSELVLIADSAYGTEYKGQFRDAVMKSIRVSSMYTSEGAWSDSRFLADFKENAKLSALFVVHPSNLHQIKNHQIVSRADFNRIKIQFKKSQNVVFSSLRSAGVPVYVIVSANLKGALALVEALGSIKEGFVGIYGGI